MLTGKKTNIGWIFSPLYLPYIYSNSWYSCLLVHGITVVQRFIEQLFDHKIVIMMFMFQITAQMTCTVTQQNKKNHATTQLKQAAAGLCDGIWWCVCNCSRYVLKQSPVGACDYTAELGSKLSKLRWCQSKARLYFYFTFRCDLSCWNKTISKLSSISLKRECNLE